MVECSLFWKLTRDGNPAGAQDRARIFAALNMPTLDIIQLPSLAQVKYQPVCLLLSFERVFFRFRCTVEIEIEKPIPRIGSNRFKCLSVARKNLLRLFDRPILGIQHANRSLLRACFSRPWHQTCAVFPGYDRLCRNRPYAVFASVRFSFHSDKLCWGYTSIWRVLWN